MIRIERSWYGPSLALEPWPLLLALLTLTAVSALAAYIPSRRATALDPATVLRADS
jgi:ABC-type lipoprotein release transport system permease subunit